MQRDSSPNVGRTAECSRFLRSVAVLVVLVLRGGGMASEKARFASAKTLRFGSANGLNGLDVDA